MAENQHHTKQTKTKRSNRQNGTAQSVVQSDEQVIEKVSTNLREVDDIISDIMSAPETTEQDVLGKQDHHDDITLSNEQRVNLVRQHGGQ
jgi:hypothetical protein